jgi:hypothetical protein
MNPTIPQPLVDRILLLLLLQRSLLPRGIILQGVLTHPRWTGLKCPHSGINLSQKPLFEIF